MTKGEDDVIAELVRHISDSPEISRQYGYLGPGLSLAGRFDVEGRLGAGGMGHVFAAFDRVLGTRVALKCLGKMTPRAIVRLKQEFRVAADLVHPHLVRLHELFCDDPEWFFTMELVDGLQLSQLGRLDLALVRLRRLFLHLAEGVHALHQIGIVHADLKPSNFLITRDTERGVLIDFGLARLIGAEGLHQRGGTPAYMAPEQALGQSLTEASDWYSLGVMLYEALTRSLPTPRPSSERLAAISGDLGQLCMDLLHLSPEARPEGTEVLRRLGGSVIPGRVSATPRRLARASGPQLYATLSPRAAQPLIGRARELAQLDAAFALSSDGEPAFVVVQGPSGIGKSALLRHFSSAVLQQGGTVIEGHCRERESMGYKAVDGLIDSIVDLLDSLPYEEAIALLPPNVADLTILFPALRAAEAAAQLPKPSSPSAVNHALIRLRAVAAFVELLRRLRRRAPLLVSIDDLQWGDEESSLLLGAALAGPAPVPLLLLGACRGDATERGPLLEALLRGRGMPRALELLLEPLLPEDATEFACSLLPAGADAGERRAREIVRDAGGHPLFIAELVHAARTLNEGSPAPTTLAALVGDRVTSLPERERRLLEITAVAGIPIGRSVLRQTMALGVAETEDCLRSLRAQRLARSHGSRDEDTIDIHHDRIREIIVQRLSAAELRSHHASLARILELHPTSKPEFIASQYEAAGELERAAHHWLTAADRAAAALAFSHAAELYGRAVRHGSLDPAQLQVARRGRALALAHAGRGKESADAYLEAAEGVPPEEVLELQRQAAEQLLLSGHVEQGQLLLQRVLTSTGMRRTRGGRQALISLLLGRLRLRLRGLQHLTRPGSALSRREITRLDTSWSIACSFGVIDPICGADFQTKHLMLALAAGEPRRVLRALTVEAAYVAAAGAGTEARTTQLLAMSDALSGGTEDHAAVGFGRMTHGLVSYLQGRLEPALRDLDQAQAILVQHSPGAIWETVTTRRFFIATLFFLGRWRQLQEVVPPLLAEAEGMGNLYATMCFRTGYSSAAWICRDETDEARQQLDRARSDWKTNAFQLSHCNLLIAECYIDLYEDAPERALERLLRHWHQIKQGQLLRVGVLRVQLLQLRAAAAAAAAADRMRRGAGSSSAGLQREARRWLQRLRSEKLPRATPLSSLVEAALDVQCGYRTRAVQRLQSASAALEAQKMQLFAAAARVRFGELTGGERGRELRAEGVAVFEREGVVRPDRVIRMLAPGFPLES